MLFNGLEFIRLEADTDILPFDCGNTDLNGFLFDDAKPFLKELLATTFIIHNKAETVAYFNYLNDKISHTDLGNNKDAFIKRVSTLLPLGKDKYTSYPAVKIGRLAVSCNSQNQKLGQQILDFTKTLFIDNNRTGCKFITVDAYKNSVDFYTKNGFKFLSSQDKNSDTRLMYYNLGNL